MVLKPGSASTLNTVHTQVVEIRDTEMVERLGAARKALVKHAESESG